MTKDLLITPVNSIYFPKQTVSYVNINYQIFGLLSQIESLEKKVSCKIVL